VDYTNEQKQKALEQALHSRTFARADQLRKFLRFVCEAEMTGDTERLTESVIGIEVLGRPKDFAPIEDSTVRTRAYELRHRLEKLYSLEAPESELRIILPKGSYVPRYERTSAPAAPDPPPPNGDHPQDWAVAPLPASLPTRGSLRVRYLLVFLAGAVVAGLLATAAALQFRRSEIDPILREAWAPFLNTSADALICVATPLHLTVGPAEHQVEGKPYFPAPAEAYPLFRETRPLDQGAKLGLLFTDNVLGFGTMNAVHAASTRLREMGVRYQVFPERVSPAPTFRERHVLLFGAPVDSDAITRALESAPITVDFDPPSNEFVIRYRDSGKKLIPTKDPKGEYTEVFGLLSVLNNRRSPQGPLAMVVFSGITSTGTQGAAEFFSNPDSLRELKARFAGDGVPGFPESYQVVVKCRFGNRLLLTYEGIDHRILNPR
jgi:hypothetical protein